MTETKTTVELWPNGVPDGNGFSSEDASSMTLYPPADKASSGAAMLVLPGGCYGGHADHEGQPVAEYLSNLGIFAATLKYRLGPKHRHPAMLSDAKRALRLLRFRAGEWGIDPQRVGIIGFSAGGHLAAMASVHYDAGDFGASDPVDRLSSRPGVSLLVYAVLEMEGDYMHALSRRNLLGEDASPEMVQFMTMRSHVTSDTPPTLLVTAVDDREVPVENTLHYALALSAAKVPFQILAYQQGGHGFGLGNPGSIVGRWSGEASLWLRSYGYTLQRQQSDLSVRCTDTEGAYQ